MHFYKVTHVDTLLMTVINELDGLSRGVKGNGPGFSASYNVAGSAADAVDFLERSFDIRNKHLKAITSKGTILDTIAYRSEESNRIVSLLFTVITKFPYLDVLRLSSFSHPCRCFMSLEIIWQQRIHNSKALSGFENFRDGYYKSNMINKYFVILPYTEGDLFHSHYTTGMLSPWYSTDTFNPWSALLYLFLG